MNDEDLLDKYGLLPKTNTAKKAKTEDQEILSKYGLDKIDETIAEPKDKWWKVNHADSSYSGVAKKFGIGALRGANDVLDTAAHGLGNATSYVADKILPESLAGPIRRSVEKTKLSDLTDRNEFDEYYPSNDGILPTFTDVGRFTGQAVATLPVMPAKAMQGIAAASGALPTILANGGKVAAPMVNRLISSAGQGAVGGAVFNAATSSANDKSLAENIGEGALGGALAGPAVTLGASTAKGVVSKLTGKISPERAELARKASDHGIDLEASQVSTSPTLKKFNQISGMVPFSGAQAASEKQINQFTRAISRTFGQDTTNITPDVLKKAKVDLGHNYDTVAANTSIPVTKKLANDLAKVVDHANDVISDPNQLATFHKQLDNIINKFKGGSMTGEQWQAMRKTGEPLSVIANSNRNTTLGQSVKGLIVAMDAAFNDAAPKEMQSLLKKTNQQYKAMKTVEKLANSDAEGHISPLKLMSKVVNSPYGGKSGAGPLGDLADIGRAFFPQPADSGTPLGEAIISKIAPAVSSPVTGLAAAAGSLAGGAPILATLEGTAGAIANRLIRKSLNSKPVLKSLINSANGANYGLIDKAAEKSVPYSGNLLKKDKKDNFKLPVALLDHK